MSVYQISLLLFLMSVQIKSHSAPSSKVHKKLDRLSRMPLFYGKRSFPLRSSVESPDVPEGDETIGWDENAIPSSDMKTPYENDINTYILSSVGFSPPFNDHSKLGESKGLFPNLYKLLLGDRFINPTTFRQYKKQRQHLNLDSLFPPRPKKAGIYKDLQDSLQSEDLLQGSEESKWYLPSLVSPNNDEISSNGNELNTLAWADSEDYRER
ncbi:uncharacterized protein LOC129923518 [Biomphalaria glabrata]|uniref:Uncharacterized protein LOC129923518 n=1 Tax=Biomphalaria glabrata TaxID=6526 RepID=A0A9W2Z710_BIOGL|nr:uncharacterized protein LOC129923518 [Biomphalaria glabrata]XP_055870836.1 uncharacterized protein LOC129923518 [Biomphalaria glabrata]XP_055870837.1 uncharacterized protein LOC129923518 [Biomphalaria glabrata]